MTGPEVAVVNALAVIAVLLAAYVALVGVAGIVLRLIGAHMLARAVDAVTPRLMRQLAASVMGAALASPMAALASQGGPEPPIVMHRLPDEAPVPTTTTTTSSTTTTTTTPLEAPQPATPPAPSPPPAASPPPTTWVVEPGQHFWAVAERVLSAAWGREATDAEVVPYWRELIEANRDRLVDRANPDLVYPGQEFVLPATT